MSRTLLLVLMSTPQVLSHHSYSPISPLPLAKNQRMYRYKLLSPTYTVLTTAQLSISICWSLFRLLATFVLHPSSPSPNHSHSPLSKSLIAFSDTHHHVFGINFQTKLPTSFRQPHPDHSPSDSSHSTHLGLPAPLPQFSPSIIPL